jgi:hypothetical protein
MLCARRGRGGSPAWGRSPPGPRKSLKVGRGRPRGAMRPRWRRPPRVERSGGTKGWAERIVRRPRGGLPVSLAQSAPPRGPGFWGRAPRGWAGAAVGAQQHEQACASQPRHVGGGCGKGRERLGGGKSFVPGQRGRRAPGGRRGGAAAAAQEQVHAAPGAPAGAAGRRGPWAPLAVGKLAGRRGSSPASLPGREPGWVVWGSAQVQWAEGEPTPSGEGKTQRWRAHKQGAVHTGTCWWGRPGGALL